MDTYFFKVHSKALCDVSEHTCFYSVRLLASCQTPKLEGQYLVIIELQSEL